MTELGVSMRRQAPLAIMAAYLVLGLLYSAMLPVFEAPDERQHYGYVQHLALERSLPPRADGSLAEHEASQPPLYYAVAALGTAWRSHDPSPVLEPNRYYANYQASGTVNDNKNVYLHSDLEGYPWRGPVLTVRLTRLVNLLFGGLTVAFTYLLGREIFRLEQVLALGGAAVVAFTPQFLFISSGINNDIAVTAFSTMTLWLLARGLRRGYTLTSAAVLGVAIGLSALSKISALPLLPLALLAVGLQTWAQAGELRPARRWARIAAPCSIVLAVALLVGGWWYLRGVLVYQDPLGVQTHFDMPWSYEDPLTLPSLWAQLPGVALSFWAAFGMGNVHLPWIAYLFIGSMTTLAAVGLAIWIVHSWRSGRQLGPRAWSLALLAVWVLILLVALLRWMQLLKAALGRLLFPGIAAVSILMVWGLTQIISYGLRLAQQDSRLQVRASRAAIALFAAALFVVAGAAPFLAIRPAYARPVLLSETEIAARARSADLMFGETIRLAGYGLDRRSAHPGEEVSVTLCWESVAPMDANYAYFVHLLGNENRIVGARNTFSGLGRFPTSQWIPGTAFCDVVRVPVYDDVPVQAVYDVEIGWYDPVVGRRLPAQDPAGSPMGLVLLERVKVVPEAFPTVRVPRDVNAILQDKVELLGYDLSESQTGDGSLLTVTLYWRSQSSLEHDYTVFVHLAGVGGGPPYAQSDSQPRDGSYPTSFWDVGEVVVDQHILQIPTDMPPGEYQLLAGMYLLETGDRLARVTPAGTTLSTYVPLETMLFAGSAP